MDADTIKFQNFNATPIGIKLLQLDLEENITNKKEPLIGYLIYMGSEMSIYNIDKYYYQIISYIVNKPILKHRLSTQSDDFNRNLYMLSLLPIYESEYQLKTLNLLLEQGIQPTYQELLGLEDIKSIYPTLYNKLNEIKKTYLEDKNTNHTLKNYCYFKDIDKGLTVSHKGSPKDYFNAYSLSKNNNSQIKKWGDKYKNDILNKSLNIDAKKELLELLGISNGEIHYYK